MVAEAACALPMLAQEALVLGFGLDAGSSGSHLSVNSHHLVLHQAADLQVLLQDALPGPGEAPVKVKRCSTQDAGTRLCLGTDPLPQRPSSAV